LELAPECQAGIPRPVEIQQSGVVNAGARGCAGTVSAPIAMRLQAAGFGEG